MLANNATCLRYTAVPMLAVLAWCGFGCHEGQSVKCACPQEMLTIGGIFWPDATPGFEAESSRTPVLSIPGGSVCDVRVHPGPGPGRAMVKVCVNGQWRDLWVDKVLSRDFQDIHYLPFDTFAYLSFGLETDPDRNWDRTRSRLIEAANSHHKETSDDDLRSLFGNETFAAYCAKRQIGNHK